MSLDPKQQKHIDLYQRMLLRLKAALPDFNEASIERAINDVEKEMVDLGHATAEEVRQISGFLKRDLHDLAQSLSKTEKDVARWLKFDIALIEDKLWDAFLEVADKTTVDQLYLKFRLERGPMYKTGEVTSVGTLQCDACGELLHFKKISHIPPCPKCHEYEFSRIVD